MNKKEILKLHGTCKHIANGFNDFFVKVGPNLAEGIQTPSTNIKMQDHLGPANEHSMYYLFEVEDWNNWDSNKFQG